MFRQSGYRFADKNMRRQNGDSHFGGDSDVPHLYFISKWLSR
jgi:hypothetical protein